MITFSVYSGCLTLEPKLLLLTCTLFYYFLFYFDVFGMVFQMTLMQVLPSFLDTCMHVMSTPELGDVITDLLKSMPKHLPPDLNVAWLRCIKHLAKSACFCPPGNDTALS